MEPHFNDYVELIYNRFEAFTQASASANPAGQLQNAVEMVTAASGSVSGIGMGKSAASNQLVTTVQAVVRRLG
jgi:hypothetical protein